MRLQVEFGNVYRGPGTGEREKLTGAVLMQAKAAMGSWDRRNGPAVETILNPVSDSVKRPDDLIVRVFGFVTDRIVIGAQGNGLAARTKSDGKEAR